MSRSYTSSTFAPFPSTRFLIASDSLASLMAMQDPYSTYPLVQCILTLLSVHPLPCRNIIFIWTLGHIGLTGNEVVDKAAKQASRQPRVNPRSHPTASDLISYIRQFITNQ